MVRSDSKLPVRYSSDIKRIDIAGAIGMSSHAEAVKKYRIDPGSPGTSVWFTNSTAERNAKSATMIHPAGTRNIETSSRTASVQISFHATATLESRAWITVPPRS